MRTLIRVIGALAMLSAGMCHAQNAPTAREPYPVRPVRIIVPFAAGGPGDLISRLIAQKLSEGLGKQFYVENQGGAGGNIGMGMVARAPADGYTIMIASSTFMINPSLYGKVPYDPIKDFDPVTIAATTPNVLVVHTSVPATNVKELVDLIRSRQVQQLCDAGSGHAVASFGRAVQGRFEAGADRGPVPRRWPDDSIRPRRPHADRLFIAATRRAPDP